jgi:hypothetical protein
MTHYTTDRYRIDIYADQTFTEGLADNVNQYDFVYFNKSEYSFPSVFGINIFQDNTLINSAVVGSVGVGTGIHDTSVLIENDRLLICCSDTTFCLSIPDLTLL